MLIKSLLLALTLTVLPGTAAAADHFATRNVASNTQEFFVSGVLRRNGEDITIKLVHAVEQAATKTEALDAFVAKVQAEYPDYAVLDTLVSPAGARAPVLRARPPVGVNI